MIYFEKPTNEAMTRSVERGVCSGSQTGCGYGDNYDKTKSLQKHGQNQKMQSGSGGSCTS